LVNPQERFGVPEGIIAHLTKECGGNVHDYGIVEVTSGSFEYTTRRPNGCRPAQCVADLEVDSTFYSAYRRRNEEIPHTRNNWICYDFKDRVIVPSHYAIRSYVGDKGSNHLKSWIIETSTDAQEWTEVDRQEDNDELNGIYLTGTFALSQCAPCRFIRLVNIGKNHFGYDSIMISAWEIFGTLLA
jgi:hypothetical protein